MIENYSKGSKPNNKDLIFFGNKDSNERLVLGFCHHGSKYVLWWWRQKLCGCSSHETQQKTGEGWRSQCWEWNNFLKVMWWRQDITALVCCLGALCTRKSPRKVFASVNMASINLGNLEGKVNVHWTQFSSFDISLSVMRQRWWLKLREKNNSPWNLDRVLRKISMLIREILNWVGALSL